MSESNRQIERLVKLGCEDDNDLRDTTIEERWNMMWQLAVDSWAMQGINVVEQELQGHVECLKRLGS